MQDKYIELIIDKCMDLNRSKVVFLSYNKEIKFFVDKLIKKLHDRGVKDIYEDIVDVYERHDYLKSHTIEEISTSEYFDCSVWDEYAKKNANFLLIETEVPHINDDIEPLKLSEVAKRKIDTKPYYRELQNKCKLLWAIVSFPSEKWAKDIFDGDNDACEKLENSIYKICMVDRDNPVDSWNKYLAIQSKIIDKLNNLNLKKLHYSNSLGTDLDIYLVKNYRYSSAYDNGIMVNMPSYEVFTSPVYNKTCGIVYSSKALIYNGGIIDEFWLRFKDGKVIEYDAKKGKDILKGIIETDEYSCYLGEAALVEKDSPIASMNINFGTTLIDENASCHLALGEGFPECVLDGIELDEDELRKIGINKSKAHVDFMFGTDDLEIIGETYDGKKVKIFEMGNFSKEIKE